MSKNVKGFIGLFTGLAAFILLIAAFLIPTAPIQGTVISLYGGANVIMALIAAALGITAIVFGIISIRDSDKKGPRKAGIIIGSFAIIISLLSSGIFALTGALTDYANGKKDTVFSQIDNKSRAELDKSIKELKEAFEAEQTAE